MSDSNTPRPGDQEYDLLRKILNRIRGGGGPWEPELGYTPENIANKAQSLSPTSLDEYPSSRATALYIGIRVRGAGSSQLVNGHATVVAPSITSGVAVSLTHRAASGTLGHLSFVITDGVGFDITSTSATDQSLVDYLFTDDVS